MSKVAYCDDSDSIQTPKKVLCKDLDCTRVVFSGLIVKMMSENTLRSGLHYCFQGNDLFVVHMREVFEL